MSQTQALAKPNGIPAKTEDFDLELIRRTVAKGATDDELALYLHDCQRRGVHPLDRLLHFTVRQDQQTKARTYTPLVSIDLFRSRAAGTGQYAGSDDPAHVVDADAATYPQQSTVTVYRLVGGIRCPFTATARWFEYKPEKNDFMWRRMPFTMLGKCAEALALRKAFPAELSGLHTEDEMAQSPAIDPDMTAEGNSLPPQQQLAARQANPQVRKEYCSQRQQDSLRDLSDELGLSNEEKVEICRRYSVKRATHLTVDQCQQLVLDLKRRAVEKYLAQLTFNLDDVRLEAPSVAADVPADLDDEQADAALVVLRQCIARATA